jgi:uncharacterized membrane protein YdjX (TVP38/TMEM64 family)
MKVSLRFVSIGALILLALVGVFVLMAEVDRRWLTPEGVMEVLDRAAHWGPLLVVLTMSAAVVISPIPSAPIAIAAGAAYGHLWGTVYALIGAELGALIAFEIARRWGRKLVSRWIGGYSLPSLLASQFGLALSVFAARLLPAISFDVVSYAAGLTRLERHWFALATGLGMVPATFLLSHAGAGLRSVDSGFSDILVTISGLGFLAILGLFFGVRRRAALARRSPCKQGEC